MNHPYFGREIHFVTMHEKERALGPLFQRSLQARLLPQPHLDTDQFGTFGGEIARTGTVRETLRAKIDHGRARTGATLLIASEGSFGPDPAWGFVASDNESLLFKDFDRGVEIFASYTTPETNFDHVIVAGIHELGDFLKRSLFPTHALMVQPQGLAQGPVRKGLKDESALHVAIAQAVAQSPEGKALVSTDMRANFNPTRMKAIATAGERLLEKILSLCPNCQSPGFGLRDVMRGLPCAECGEPTELVAKEVFSCPACDHEELRPRSDGLTVADPDHCGNCNP